MRPLSEMYTDSFYHNRHRLHWRAPIVISTLVATFPAAKTYIDVGCGTGELVLEAEKNFGLTAWGLEGSPACTPYMVTDHFFIQDLRNLNLFRVSPKYDVLTCLEVAEHIEEEYTDIFLDNLVKLSDNIVMSTAAPGQKGIHHVNLQEKEYWIIKMKDRGMMLSTVKTTIWREELRRTSTRKELKSYYKNGMVFIKY